MNDKPSTIKPPQIREFPLTIKMEEAMERYGCDRAPIRKAIDDGLIEAYRPGKAILIVKESGDRWFLSKRMEKKKPIGRPRKRRGAA